MTRFSKLLRNSKRSNVMGYDCSFNYGIVEYDFREHKKSRLCSMTVLPLCTPRCSPRRTTLRQPDPGKHADTPIAAKIPR